MRWSKVIKEWRDALQMREEVEGGRAEEGAETDAHDDVSSCDRRQERSRTKPFTNDNRTFLGHNSINQLVRASSGSKNYRPRISCLAVPSWRRAWATQLWRPWMKANLFYGIPVE